MRTIKKTEVITFRTDMKTKEKLESFAAEKKWSVSQFTEEVIGTYVNAREIVFDKMSHRDDEEIVNLPQISKDEEKVLYRLSEELGISFKEALSYAITYTGITWPTGK